MSVELPEAHILSGQMSEELSGKRIKSFLLRDYKRLQRVGFVNKDIKSFDQLVNGKIESVTSRGNVIRVRLDSDVNLILGPEYGGKVLFHTKGGLVPKKFHLKVDFDDNTFLTVALTGMGVIQAFKDNELDRSYVYRRDFSTVASPLDDVEFTLERFCKQLSERKVNIKSVLVGKDAIVVGLSNSAFQDILFRAKIHPKRKASELNEREMRCLYDAIGLVIRDRIRLGGKEQFTDLYGVQGHYEPVMGPNMKGKPCQVCGNPIEKLSLGGGQVFFCPNCQM